MRFVLFLCLAKGSHQLLIRGGGAAVNQPFALGKRRPVFGRMVIRDRQSQLKEMAVSNSQSIGGIQFFRHLLLGNMQKTLQHTRHLLFARMTVSCNRHLYLHRRILIYRDVSAQSRSNCHPLRMYNLNHCLRVLVHKLCLDCQFRRLILVYQFLQKEKLPLQAGILSFQLMHIHYTKVHQLHPLPRTIQQGISHKQCSRVNTKYPMLLYQTVLHFSIDVSVPRYPIPEICRHLVRGYEEHLG